MNDRLRSDRAWAIAYRTLEVIKPLLREEEHGDFMAEAISIALQELQKYDEAQQLQQRRLHPLKGGGHDGAA